MILCRKGSKSSMRELQKRYLAIKKAEKYVNNVGYNSCSSGVIDLNEPLVRTKDREDSRSFNTAISNTRSVGLESKQSNYVLGKFVETEDLEFIEDLAELVGINRLDVWDYIDCLMNCQYDRIPIQHHFYMCIIRWHLLEAKKSISRQVIAN